MVNLSLRHLHKENGVLARGVLMCVVLSTIYSEGRPTGNGRNNSGDNTGSNRHCNVPEVTFENSDHNVSDAELQSTSRYLSTRIEGLLFHTETLMNKVATLLKSKFALDCVDTVTSYSVAELDCDNTSSSGSIDEFRSCALSAYKVMEAFSVSLDLISKWETGKHLILTKTDLSDLKTNVDQFICDAFIAISPMFMNKSEMLDFSPEPVRLVHDVTDSSSKRSLADLIKFDNKKCGKIDSDLNAIQDMHFLYQFLYDLTETSKRLHFVFSHAKTTSGAGSIEVLSSSSPVGLNKPTTDRQSGLFNLHMREIITG